MRSLECRISLSMVICFEQDISQMHTTAYMQELAQVHAELAVLRTTLKQAQDCAAQHAEEASRAGKALQAAQAGTEAAAASGKPFSSSQCRSTGLPHAQVHSGLDQTKAHSCNLSANCPCEGTDGLNAVAASWYNISSTLPTICVTAS